MLAGAGSIPPWKEELNTTEWLTMS
jgi:hypothetical protein